jgi:hypothetical protein
MVDVLWAGHGDYCVDRIVGCPANRIHQDLFLLFRQVGFRVHQPIGKNCKMIKRHSSVPPTIQIAFSVIVMMPP